MNTQIDTTDLPPGVIYRTTWGNYKTEARRAYGHAARRNRSRNKGVKIHRLVCTYVVGVIDPALETRHDTFGAKFLKTGQPVLFSVHPVCGCTSGQHAGAPDARLTAEHVTCSKCEQPAKT